MVSYSGFVLLLYVVYLAYCWDVVRPDLFILLCGQASEVQPWLFAGVGLPLGVLWYYCLQPSLSGRVGLLLLRCCLAIGGKYNRLGLLVCYWLLLCRSSFFPWLLVIKELDEACFGANLATTAV